MVTAPLPASTLATAGLVLVYEMAPVPAPPDAAFVNTPSV
jgi:hypothetical protein